MPINDSIYENIRDIISLLVIDFPFAMPLIKFDIESCEDKTIKTDGKRLFINPFTWGHHPNSQREGMLLHEWLHIALLHPFRGHGKNKKIL